MEFGDVPAWIALVLSAIAVIVSIRARGDGKESAAAATRSAEAAEEALALQRQEAADRREAEVEATRPRVDLRIVHVKGTRYRITNHGQAAASNLVFVDPPENAHGLNDPITLGFNDGHDFNVLAAMGVPVPPSLRAVWDGQPEPVTVAMPPA